jgi:hypothetical protein
VPVATPHGRDNLDPPATPNDYDNRGATSSSARRRRRARSALRLAALSFLVGIVVDGIVRLSQDVPSVERAFPDDYDVSGGGGGREEGWIDGGGGGGGGGSPPPPPGGLPGAAVRHLEPPRCPPKTTDNEDGAVGALRSHCCPRMPSRIGRGASSSSVGSRYRRGCGRARDIVTPCRCLPRL